MQNIVPYFFCDFFKKNVKIVWYIKYIYYLCSVKIKQTLLTIKNKTKMKTNRIITTLVLMVIVALAFGAKKPTSTIKERITLEQCVFEYYDSHSDTYLVKIKRLNGTELKTIVTKDVYENMQMSGFAWSLVLDKMRVNGKEKVIVSIIPDLQRRPTK